MPSKRTSPQTNQPERPSTEAQSRQGSWTAAQKLALLTEYDSYPQGDPRRGELLRRHGLYTSHMSTWRAQRNQGALASLEARPAGRPAQPRDEHQDEIVRLQRENARLQAELQKAETIIDIQKKVATLLGVTMPIVPNGAE